MAQKAFTVFTPTYQRASTLPRVYESLLRQTYKDFEWLIVDDGSTDGTGCLVRKWQKEAPFPIRYRFQVNSGKHVAFNRGVAAAKGRFFLTLDSDDSCIPEALERLQYWWDSIPVGEQHHYSAVTVNCCDEKGLLVGTPFPKSPLDSNSAELRFKHKVQGEKWGFHRTEVLREFPFPESGSSRFVAESVVWRMIGKKYRTRFVNEMLRIYWPGDSSGNQTVPRLSALSKEVLHGRMLAHLQTLNEFSHYFWNNPLAFLSAASNVARYGFQLGLSPQTLIRDVNKITFKAMVIAMTPVGAAYALRDSVRGRGR